MKRNYIFLILLCCIFPFTRLVAQQVYDISTVAGQNGLYGGFSGDGYPATSNVSATFNYTYGVAADDSGNIYIADWANNVIRKVNKNDIVSSYVGFGWRGYAGDGGPATLAKMNHPTGVAVDKKGNLYIADDSNNVVRIVSTSGIINTIAGNGINGFSGDGGQATNASLNYPSTIAVDTSGNLFIADQGNNRTRKVDVTGVITTVAGNGSSGYSGNGGPATAAELNTPYGVAVDTIGNLFIADTKNNVVRKVNTTGTISTFAGKLTAGFSGDYGPATAAELNTPYGVMVDKAGDVLIVDTHNNRIRKVTPTGIIRPCIGTSPGGFAGDGGIDTLADVNYPYGVAADPSGNMYVADTYNDRIRKVSTNKIISTWAGNGYIGYSGDGYSAVESPVLLNEPWNAYVDNKGNIFIADWGNHRVRKVNTNGIISTFAGNGSNVTNGDGGPATAAGISFPVATTSDTKGNVYISTTANVIRKVDTSGIITTFVGTIGVHGYTGDGGPATAAEIYNPTGLMFDKAGNLLFCDEVNNVVRKVDTDGIITTIIGNGYNAGTGYGGYSGNGGPATAAELDFPLGIAQDRKGNTYLAESDNYLRKIDKYGTITFVAGGWGGNDILVEGYFDGIQDTNARFYSLDDVATDTLGNIYTSDGSTDRIQKIDTNGIIRTIAGQLFAGGSIGDGGPALLGRFDDPNSIYFDNLGNGYVTDFGNNSIRKLHPCNISVSASVVAQVSCNGGSSGMASVIATAGVSPYTYQWNPSLQTSATATGLSAGTYTVIAWDNTHCSSYATVTITQPANPLKAIAWVKTNVSCRGGSNGSAYPYIVYPGSLPYTYQWSDGNSQTSAVATGLSAGTYSLTVTDSCGATYTSSVTMLQPDSLVANTSVFNDPSCYGQSTGSISSWPTGGTSPFTYQWSDSHLQTSYFATGLSAGSYTVTITDSCGFVSTASATITTPAQLIMYPTVDHNPICPGECADISFAAGGGVWPYYYSWTNGDTTVCPNSTATYKCYMYDQYGCRDTGAVTITVNTCTGIQQVNNSNAVEIYPNPATDIINIQLNYPADGDLTITDVLGQQVHSEKIARTNTTKQIYIGDLSQGVYMLKIVSAGQSMLKMFVKL